MARKKLASEIIEATRSTITTLLISNQIPVELSEQIAINVTDQLQTEWGGTSLYFPKTLDKTQRNRAITKEFNGKNMQELCKKYKLTESYIYTLVRESREY